MSQCLDGPQFCSRSLFGLGSGLRRHSSGVMGRTSSGCRAWTRQRRPTTVTLGGQDGRQRRSSVRDASRKSSSTTRVTASTARGVSVSTATTNLLTCNSYISRVQSVEAGWNTVNDIPSGSTFPSGRPVRTVGTTGSSNTPTTTVPIRQEAHEPEYRHVAAYVWLRNGHRIKRGMLSLYHTRWI